MTYPTPRSSRCLAFRRRKRRAHGIAGRAAERSVTNAVAIQRDGRVVYVLDRDGDPAVIDTASQERPCPFGGQLAYMIHDADTQIFVIDVATSQLVNSLEASGLTTDLAVTPDGRFVYVAQRTRHQLSVIETGTTMFPTHPVSWSGTADGIAMMPDGLTAYVSDRQSRAIQVIPVQPQTA